MCEVSADSVPSLPEAPGRRRTVSSHSVSKRSDGPHQEVIGRSEAARVGP
jgi:hypothetical protein